MYICIYKYISIHLDLDQEIESLSRILYGYPCLYVLRALFRGWADHAAGVSEVRYI